MAIILTQDQVRDLLPMPECIEQVDAAFRMLAEGRAQNPLRWAMRLEMSEGILGLMPGAMESPEVVGLKVVAIHPSNHGSELDSHQGIVTLFDVERGVPLAVMEASAFTAIRTAAASAVATRVLAREDAHDLAVLGSGVQAQSHIEAMHAVRELSRVRIYSPNAQNREALAEAQCERLAIDVQAMESAREAVEGADLICVATAAREPVLRGVWIAPGAHVNAVGACLPVARELDSNAVARSRMFVDRQESARSESGDFLIARDEGAIDDDHIVGEIGDVLLERVEGRQAADDITLFESLGLAVEDLATAHYVYERARAEGIGVDVDLAGRR